MLSDDTPYGYYDFSDDEPYAEAPDVGEAPVDVLRRVWGYDAFRPMQAEIVESVLGGHDTIGLLPTGGGKSLTFQVPALIMPGITLVVTPLVSLMKDQVDSLKRRRVKADCLYLGMSRHAQDYTLERCRQGKLKLLYIAPERIERQQFIAEIARWDVSMIVVDEAHCISQWGYDFRPSYLGIRRLRELFPDVPVLALTASATPEVVADIAASLAMRSPKLFSLSFARPNISFLVRRTDAKAPKMLQIFSTMPGCGIVYVRSRKRTVELADFLNGAGIAATAYHAGLPSDVKAERQEAWMEGRVRVMVATTAFGMGIDKPDVRLVVHHDMPSTLEEYYQEAGRAGRDGQKSVAVLLVSRHDKATLARRLTAAFPPKEFIAHVYDEICRYLSLPMGEGFGAVFEFDPAVMCERYKLDYHRVITSIGFLERAGYLTFVEELERRSRVMITVERHRLYDEVVDSCHEAVMLDLLRNYPGLFADYVFIDEQAVAYRCGLAPEEVYKALIAMRRQHILDYVPRSLTPYIFFTANRCPSDKLIIEQAIYERRRDSMKKRLDAMSAFAFDDTDCRVRRMLQYFGQRLEPGYGCGSCDICRSRRNGRPPFDAIAFAADLRDIFASIAPAVSIPMGSLTARYPHHTAEVGAEISALISSGHLALNGALLTLLKPLDD